MSTTIGCAWIIRGYTMRQLINLAKEVSSIHNGSFCEEYSQMVLRNPWESEKIIPSIKKKCNSKEALQQIKRAVAKTLANLLDQGESSSTWIFTDKELLYFFLNRNFSDRGISVSSEIKELMEELIVDCYEAINRSDPSLTFLPYNSETTFVKGFGLTDADEKFLNQKFRAFVYTNATDMDAKDFDDEQVFADYKKCSTSEGKYAVLRAAQEERGRMWDQALDGEFCLGKAGLGYDLKRDFRMQRIQYLNRILDKILN